MAKSICNFKMPGRIWLFAAVILAVSGSWGFTDLQSVYAADRGPIEICGNDIDDDGDGTADETTQGGCFEGDGTPASGDGVVPEEWTDNPSCEDLGYSFGFKIEGGSAADYTGTFQFTNADGILTGGAPEDPSNSVTLTSDGTSLDWASTIGIDAVFMKGGPGGNAYIYDPEDTGDTGLATPGGGPALSHVEFCYDYELEVEKTAEGVFDRHIDWTIEKSVTPAQHDLFAGQNGASGYTVTATKTVTDSNYRVSGEITITNPAPFDVDFHVTDTLDGVTAKVDCDPGTEGFQNYGTVSGSGSVTCTYVATESDGVDGDESLNTAVVSSDTPGVRGGEATASISFTPEVTGDPEVINVTDDHDNDGLDQDWGPVSETTTWEYNGIFTCSDDPADYADGSYSFDENNTATIDETGESDSETVTVNCYAPTVAKDADTEWFEKYEWAIDKSVDPDAHTGFAGDTFTSSYDVSVDQTVTSYGFRAFGSVYVSNPAGAPGAITVDVADAVNGTGAIVDCGGGSTGLTVAPGTTESCSYTVDLPNNSDLVNTATVTFNDIAFTATADVIFGPPVIVGYPTINVTDTNKNGLGSASGDFTFEYDLGFQCPTDESLYTDGVYTESLPNTATIDETGQSDDANVDLTCYIPARAKVVKTTTEGGEDIGQFPFTFELYDPSGTLVETQTLNGAGEVTFAAELRTEGTWTVKEVLPAGWVSQTDLTCDIVVAYPGSAGQTYTCTFDNVEKSRVDLLKLTNGQPTTTQTWNFAIYEGPDGFGGTPVASDSTPPALLDFGNTDLDPSVTYTLCELEIPAGYSSRFEWILLDGAQEIPIVPYNPNADDDPPEDLGNRCVDIGANTSIPLEPGTTLHFKVDNQQPGGAPRTPGYWKNWNTCTGGNQQYTAAANGGYAEGFWLIEDVLDPAIGGGIIWDDILSDFFVYMIDRCEVAVDILDKREVGDVYVVGDGKKRASDPLHNLATHLLAAQLNFGANACTTQEVLDAALAAEALLDKYNFDGNGHDPLSKKSPDAELANSLADYLDSYNNSEFCGDGNE